MSIILYTITHKPFTPPTDPMYVPLHVGRAWNNTDLGFLSDDTGDSISELNPYFCELTGIYWIWKNVSNCDYVGISHYRRYLVNEQNCLFTEAELTGLLQKYDMITTKLLTLPGSYYDGFKANHHVKDLHILEEVIKERCPEYHDTFLHYVHGPHTYFGNIFITSKKIFASYCEWLFDILFEVYKRTDFTGYNGYQKRLLGFLSEFLQTIWIHHNCLSVLECMVGIVGEKHETETLKQQLAAFFEKGNYLAAKECFLSAYQKRPDILMEASDINGELRLCMQIISTCEFENEAYGHCILEHYHTYAELVAHFKHLNSVASSYINHEITESEWEDFQKEELFTPISIKIALKLLT